MKKWLTSVFLLFSLAGGVLAGMPLHAGNTNSQMKCCKKAKSKEQTPEVKAARLCCALNCTESAPTSGGASFNFSPAAFIISETIINQIVSLLLIKQKSDSTAAISYNFEIPPRRFPPKYIQHHSILI
jgi:hypothetical protein